MKKLIYTMGILCVMALVSCAEDRGTSTEVADANAHEEVNPSTINNYDQPGTAGYANASVARKDQLKDASATQLVELYYRMNIQPGENLQDTTLSSTALMGGKALEDTTTQHDKVHGSTETQATKASAEKQKPTATKKHQ